MIYRYDLETGENVVVMDNKLISASQLAQKPQARQLFEDSMSAVTSLAFSPDGGLLASGSNDKSIRLWDASSGTLLETMTAHEQLVSDIDFSHDGLFLASASHDGVVNIWDLETNVNDTLSKDSGAILSLDFSPINRSLVVGGVQASWVWDVTEFPPRIKYSQRYPGAQINIVKYSAEGDLMAQGSSDNSVWIRNSADGKFVTRLAGHEGDILSLAFSPDGKYLASGSADAVVNIWEVHHTGAGEMRFERVLSIRHFDWINDLAFSPDSKLLAVASFGSDVTLWEIPSGVKVGKSFASRWYQPLSVEFSPEGDQLAVGSGWGGLQLWDNPVP
jgi:WD40 repeat protein